jgi:hypothetical protein
MTVFQPVLPEAAAIVRDSWIELWVSASNAGGAIDFAEPVGPLQVEPLVDAEIHSAAGGLSTIGVVLGPDNTPGAIEVGPGDFRDEITMLTRL